MKFKFSSFKQPLKLASLPGRIPDFRHLPYINLFYDALIPHGIENACEFQPSIIWLIQKRKKIDAIHIHWPEKIWRGEYSLPNRLLHNMRGYYSFRNLTTRFRALPGLFMFDFLLRFVKSCSLKIIWTVHELDPHSGLGRIDDIGYQIMTKYSDMIIVHSMAAKKSFISEYGAAEKIIFMRHGNFTRAYSIPQPRDIVLKKLGIQNDLPIICLLGSMRKYKGVDLALETAARMDKRVQFLVAGMPFPDFPVTVMMQKVQKMDNVIMIPRSLTPQEFADYAGSSEAFLLPYKNITTSGAMHAAFTFDCGVIASKLPYFEEALEDHPDCGRLAKNYNSESFAQAIESYLTIPAERRREAASKYREQTHWEDVVVPVVEKMKSCCI